MAKVPEFNPRRWLAGFLALGAAGLVACSIQMKALTRSGPLSVKAAKCGECHVDIYNEWKTSLHAAAWTDPLYRDETLDYQVKACRSCHIPQTIFTGGKPVETRSYKQDEGVNCNVCHLNGGRQQGPFKPGPATPHATLMDPNFHRDAALCGKCHEGTYETWKQAKAADVRVKTCQECHMPSVRRKLTQATSTVSAAIVALHEEYDVRRHLFTANVIPQTPAVEIEVMPDRGTGGTSETAQISIHNLLPHTIPTGDFGFRAAVLTVELLDEGGRMLDRQKREFYKHLGTAIAPGARVIVPVDLAPLRGGSGRIRIMMHRLAANGATTQVIADQTRPIPAKTGGRQP